MNNSPIQVQQFQFPPGEGRCHFEGEHTLFMVLSPRPIYYRQAQDGKQHRGLYRKGDMSITPADLPFFAQWEGNEHYLEVRLDAQFMQRVAEETLAQKSDRIALQPKFQIRDPQLEAIALMLATELQQDNTPTQLYLDSLTNVLVVNLLRQHTTRKTELPTYQGGLPQRQLRRILDYIEAHLDQDINLTDLAQLLDMSHFHFSRLFKQSMGITPYQYLLQQRVERAKRLLKDSDRLIVEIALDCGFNSHSHLSKQFRQLTGLTPKAYRAS